MNSGNLSHTMIDAPIRSHSFYLHIRDTAGNFAKIAIIDIGGSAEILDKTVLRDSPYDKTGLVEYTPILSYSSGY